MTILEISALGDNAGNGLAKRAVGPVAGMVRTLEKELEFNCRMQRLPESMTIVWIMGHTTTMLNLDTVGSGEKVPFERWRGRGHHMGRCVLENECGIEWVHSQVEGRPRTDGIWHIRWQRLHVDWRLARRKLLGQSGGDSCQKGRPTLRRSSAYRFWPWDRPGHRQESAVRPMGERRGRNR